MEKIGGRYKKLLPQDLVLRFDLMHKSFLAKYKNAVNNLNHREINKPIFLANKLTKMKHLLLNITTL